MCHAVVSSTQEGDDVIFLSYVTQVMVGSMQDLWKNMVSIRLLLSRKLGFRMKYF